MKNNLLRGGLFVAAVTLGLIFKAKPNPELQQADFVDTSKFFGFTALIDINLGGSNCVCNGGSCGEANWISFRQYCGSSGSQGNTNFVCSRVDNGACN